MVRELELACCRAKALASFEVVRRVVARCSEEFLAQLDDVRIKVCSASFHGNHVHTSSPARPYVLPRPTTFGSPSRHRRGTQIASDRTCRRVPRACHLRESYPPSPRTSTSRLQAVVAGHR